jgi:mannose-6-phosphate isomerase-like protein (cupin superfamily)
VTSRAAEREYVRRVPFVDSKSLSRTERLPGWTGRVFHSDNMTFAYYEIAADAVPLHEHHHPQEEVWNVIEGSLAVTIDGEEQIAGPGCAAVIPPDTLHSARALSACRAIVVDYPLRHD